MVLCTPYVRQTRRTFLLLDADSCSTERQPQVGGKDHPRTRKESLEGIGLAAVGAEVSPPSPIPTNPSFSLALAQDSTLGKHCSAGMDLPLPSPCWVTARTVDLEAKVNKDAHSAECALICFSMTPLGLTRRTLLYQSSILGPFHAQPRTWRSPVASWISVSPSDHRQTRFLR